MRRVGNALTRHKGVRVFGSALLRCEGVRGFRFGIGCSGVIQMTRDGRRQVGIGRTGVGTVTVVTQSLSCLTLCTIGILYRLAFDFSSTEYVNSCNLWQPFILNVPHFSTEFLSFEISMPEGITQEFPVCTRVGDSMYCSFVSRFD